MQTCPIHGIAFVERPGGISKATGRPYGAFSACPGKNTDGSYCKEKPPKAVAAPANTSFQASVVLGRIEAKLDTVLSLLKEKQLLEVERSLPKNTVNGKAADIDDSEIPF